MAEFEQETLPFVLQEVFQKRGIKKLFCDLDGTLIDTPSHYYNSMFSYATAISRMNPKVRPEWVKDSMDKSLNGLRSQFSVNPALMQETARITALRFGVDFYSSETQTHLEKLMSLYETAPEVFDGVHETLTTFKQAGLDLVVATHSDAPWTNVRLAKNGLLDYFEGKIYSFDSWGQKGIPEWWSVYDDLGVWPRQVLVAGDSITSDIAPNIYLGVPPEQIFKVATSFMEANKGSLPTGVNQISEFADMPYAIIDRLYA